ncbi:GGDEF domain-containing protein [Gallaecimonas pentaromativorans]|uniref:diguanylate cyclase n=1 Tax=Gallaecimonas pentaromativorans TaxID=584787 RepID=A0A3N1PQT6_9GAMM|nr:diguanylate cyclase [Gallaecimonas pentaromativorans]ROQ30579.1 PAS domain S-box-containing protein/diguanylate cyclase (GGDEF)-like protein [Gallaecimonas pentaromativorans]
MPHSTKPPATVTNADTFFLSAANEEDLLRMVVRQMQEATLQLDTDGTVLCVNTAAEGLLGKDASHFVGRPWQQWLSSPWKEQLEAIFAQQNNKLNHQIIEPTEMTVTFGDRDILPVNLSLSFIPAKTACFLVNLQDLSRHKDEVNELFRLASTDSLTGLANRRTFLDVLEQQWQSYTAKRRPVSAIMIDVDHFKTFNDCYGHINGDKCLQRIAREISQALPDKECLAARYGGEEFTALLPGYNRQQAQSVAHLIRQRINALDFAAAGLGCDVRVSVSQGIATEVNGQFRTAEALLFAADTALYRAKAEGRDRINLSC